MNIFLSTNNGFAYRKNDSNFSNSNGRVNRATTLCRKHNKAIIKNSCQNVFTIARTKDEFLPFVLHSICQYLRKTFFFAIEFECMFSHKYFIFMEKHSIIYNYRLLLNFSIKNWKKCTQLKAELMNLPIETIT